MEGAARGAPCPGCPGRPPAGEVRLEYQGACRGCALKSTTYALGIRQKLMPIPGVTEVTVEGVRLSRAALDRAARMYAGYSPWVGPPPS